MRRLPSICRALCTVGLAAIAIMTVGCASSQTLHFRTQATEVIEPTRQASAKVSSAFGLGDADRSAVAQREP